MHRPHACMLGCPLGAAKSLAPVLAALGCPAATAQPTRFVQQPGSVQLDPLELCEGQHLGLGSVPQARLQAGRQAVRQAHSDAMRCFFRPAAEGPKAARQQLSRLYRLLAPQEQRQQAAGQPGGRQHTWKCLSRADMSPQPIRSAKAAALPAKRVQSSLRVRKSSLRRWKVCCTSSGGTCRVGGGRQAGRQAAAWGFETALNFLGSMLLAGKQAHMAGRRQAVTEERQHATGRQAARSPLR